MLLDSYEAGTPSWTPLMPQEFQQRRGYGITEFLPVLAGRVVAGDTETRRRSWNRCGALAFSAARAAACEPTGCVALGAGE